MLLQPFIFAFLKIFGSIFTALFVALIKKAKNDHVNISIIKHIKDEFQRAPGPARKLYGSANDLEKYIDDNPKKFPEVNLWDELFVNLPRTLIILIFLNLIDKFNVFALIFGLLIMPIIVYLEIHYAEVWKKETLYRVSVVAVYIIAYGLLVN